MRASRPKSPVFLLTCPFRVTTFAFFSTISWQAELFQYVNEIGTKFPDILNFRTCFILTFPNCSLHVGPFLLLTILYSVFFRLTTSRFLFFFFSANTHHDTQLDKGISIRIKCTCYGDRF